MQLAPSGPGEVQLQEEHRQALSARPEHASRTTDNLIHWFGGSAASADGKAKTRTKVMDNDQQLNAQSKAQAMDQGTFSKSQTKTRVNGDELDSDTRTMSHVPGQKPIKSTTKNSVILPEE
jgi:hypothetical protein